MVGDENELAGLEVGVDPSGRVRDDERANAERTEHPHPERDAVGADPLVQMSPAAHDSDGNAVERAEHECPGMTDRGRDRPAGDLGVRDLDPVVELVRQPAEPTPEDDSDERRELRDLPDPLHGRRRAHVDPSATRRS